jgi:hypothetical protein
LISLNIDLQTRLGEKNLGVWANNFSKVEGMPFERGNMGEIVTLRPSTGNGEGI